MSINSNLDFTAIAQSNLAGGSPIPVSVYWNGVDLSTYTGPSPFVNISTSFDKAGDPGIVEAVTTTITLTGKILRAPDAAESTVAPCPVRTLTPGGQGIQTLMGAKKELVKLFNDCPKSILEIKCKLSSGAESILAQYKDVVINSINFDRTDDNWARSIDYSIELQSILPRSGVPDYEYVTDRSDVWTIEPLEDVSYTKFTNQVKTRHEWSNPNMLPGPSSGPANSNVIRDLQVINIPQFRITRRLSAKGLGNLKLPCSGEASTLPSGTGSMQLAKLWVEKMHSKPFIDRDRTGIYDHYININDTLQQINNGLANIGNNFLYNHNRTINADVFNGTYETTDTWLAMPSGVPYIETYSIETSTGLDYIKTVTVAGNIQGLSFANPGLLFNSDNFTMSSGIFSTGTGLKLQLDKAYGPGGTPNIRPYQIDDRLSQGSRILISFDNKYNNAASGWIFDVKPYLYRRACLVINQGNDRATPYVNPAMVVPVQPPQNPIFSTETLLSVIPVSTTEGHDPKKGTITYNYQYNNKFNIISGTISENINIVNDLPTQVVSEIPVPGRHLGPIIDAAGYTAARKTLTVEIVVMPPTGTNDMFVQQRGCPLYTGGFLYTTIEKLIEGVKPYGAVDTTIFGHDWIYKNTQGQVYKTSDQDTWSPTQGRYTRTVSWIYQQCTNARNILDH